MLEKNKSRILNYSFRPKYSVHSLNAGSEVLFENCQDGARFDVSCSRSRSMIRQRVIRMIPVEFWANLQSLDGM
jgi:hypothetical protein